MQKVTMCSFQPKQLWEKQKNKTAWQKKLIAASETNLES